MGILAQDIQNVLDVLVDWLEGKGRISAPPRIIEPCSQRAIEVLESCGVLQKQSGSVSFSHQSYLDFLIAERLLNEIDKGGTIPVWLGPRERQTLFRREQLRQALALLSEESPSRFLQSVKQVLDSDGVRFYLKHLILEVVGQVEQIDVALADFCISLLNDKYWGAHVLDTVFLGHASYVHLLVQRGILEGWLTSGDEQYVGQALSLLQSVVRSLPDVVAALLMPCIERNEGWVSRILNVIGGNVTDDTEALFRLRLSLVGFGASLKYIDWLTLSKRYPYRLLRLVEASVSAWDACEKGFSSVQSVELDLWAGQDLKALSEAALQYPAETWDLFIPHIERLTRVERPGVYPWEWWGGLDDEASSDRIEIRHGIVTLTKKAGQELARKDPSLLLGKAKLFEG
jgi:hypothetical protein